MSKLLAKLPPWLCLTTLAYGFYSSNTLWVNWQTSPIDQYSWTAFLIWLYPAKNWTTVLSYPQKNVLTAAITLIFIGTLASFNLLKYIGLAFAIAALIPWEYKNLIWILLSCSWMPVFGWGMIHLIPSIKLFTLLVTRIVCALLGVLIMWRKK